MRLPPGIVWPKWPERTLDVQYYIWQDDMSGRFSFSALLAQQAWRSSFCCWTLTVRPDLTTFTLA